MSADEALAHLADQARNRQSEYFRYDGTVNVQQLVADGLGHLIKGSKWDQHGNLVVEFYDAQSALKTILQHHDRLGTADEPLHIQLNAEDIVRARQAMDGPDKSDNNADTN